MIFAKALLGLVGALLALGAAAKPTVEIQDASVRMPREGFKSTILLMTLKSKADAEWVGASSPIARSVELHTMTREGTVVQMTPVAAIALPANTEVRLRTGVGQFHLMVTGLKRVLKEGERLPFQLTFRDRKDGVPTRIDLKVKVVAPPNSHTAHHDDVH